LDGGQIFKTQCFSQAVVAETLTATAHQELTDAISGAHLTLKEEKLDPSLAAGRERATPPARPNLESMGGHVSRALAVYHTNSC
jgi:hypothetical protein